jgi:hypothetical protein
MSDALSGFLLWSEPPALRGAVERLSRLQEVPEYVEGWHKYNYVVQEQIAKVETEGPPFSHLLLVRWGGDRLILLSNHYRICEHFIEHDLRPSLPTFLRKADIGVHTLILHMAEVRKAIERSKEGEPVGPIPKPPKDESLIEWKTFNQTYNLGYASARTDAFGGSLQKIEFEGEDLMAAPLFTDAFPVARFRNCGLRHKLVNDHGLLSSYELMRIGKSGFISFPVPASPQARKQRFREVETVLRSINKWGFLK